MATKAMQRRPRFNAREYREDFLDLIKTNPEMAADSAKKLASRKVRAENQVADADSDTKNLFGGIIALALTGLVGWRHGTNRAKRDALIADWEMEGAESVGAAIDQSPYPWDHERGVSDPTKLWKIPKTVVVMFLWGTLAAVASAVRKKTQPAGVFERGMVYSTVAMGALSLAEFLGSFSYDREWKKITVDAPSSVQQAAA